jgi:hypothetical protein
VLPQREFLGSHNSPSFNGSVLNIGCSNRREIVMRRKTFDQIVTFIGFSLSALLLVAAGLLNWGATFAIGAVEDQLSAQKIVMPATNGDPKASKDIIDFFAANADKVMVDGKQAQMYADHYIGFHLSAMPTYAEASNAQRWFGGVVMLLLSIAGLIHIRRTPEGATI